MFSLCNANDAWCLFKKCFRHAIPLSISIKKPSNSKKRTRNDTIPQYLRNLIYKKTKMWKFMKLSKSEHSKFMSKKANRECKESL